MLRLFERSDWTASMADLLLHLHRKGVLPGSAAYDRAVAAFDEGWWGPADDGPDDDDGPADEKGRIEW